MLNLFLVKEKQIEAIMRYNFLFILWTKIKNFDNTTCYMLVWLASTLETGSSQK